MIQEIGLYQCSFSPKNVWFFKAAVITQNTNHSSHESEWTITHWSLQPHLEEVGVTTVPILVAMDFRRQKTFFHHLSWEPHSFQMLRNQGPHHSHLLPTYGNIWLWKEHQHEIFKFNSHLISSANTYWALTLPGTVLGTGKIGVKKQYLRPSSWCVKFHRKTDIELNRWLDTWFGVWLPMQNVLKECGSWTVELRSSVREKWRAHSSTLPWIEGSTMTAPWAGSCMLLPPI